MRHWVVPFSGHETVTCDGAREALSPWRSPLHADISAKQISPRRSSPGDQLSGASLSSALLCPRRGSPWSNSLHGAALSTELLSPQRDSTRIPSLHRVVLHGALLSTELAFPARVLAIIRNRIIIQIRSNVVIIQSRIGSRFNQRRHLKDLESLARHRLASIDYNLHL